MSCECLGIYFVLQQMKYLRAICHFGGNHDGGGVYVIVQHSDASGRLLHAVDSIIWFEEMKKKRNN